MSVAFSRPVVSLPESTHRFDLGSRPQVDGKGFLKNAAPLTLRGVTYGPFSSQRTGHPFPTAETIRDDLAQMAQLGINALRTYHQPPAEVLDLVSQQAGIGVLVDLPWSKHLCFLDSARAQAEARNQVRQGVLAGSSFPCIWAYSIGNEIPPDIVRWHGRRRIERFLAELYDVAKQADSDRLVTFANYPPTEYLDLSFLDFITFNVYLHDREAFHRYLVRLQNLIGDKPLVLGELGMDTLREGELEQANFLAGHLREAALTGVAGCFIFSWTDEWHTGNHAITDWAFGITRADRSPKAACHALREVFEASPAHLLTSTPRVSVVVCSYNGGRTLRQCLHSLSQLDYPDYEVVVIDDGSTDNTCEVLSAFPKVRAIHQENRGLSVARNVGLQAATGAIVAYTDSDCYVNRDWLTRLVAQFERSNAAAVGGPNLAPDDGRLAACVAAAPGQPMHVLESDQVAEHIPGCNMAFRREALAAINGFDPQFHAAGDDVDVCWRLQQAGYWISFAPGAFVWHHRRQTLRTYLRQQAGYGKAEALLRFKHPDKFNGRGHGIWRGVLYGASLQGLVLDQPIIYRGIFATGLFQCIYQPGPAHWAMLPSTLEWHLLALAVLVVGCFWWPLAIAAGGMLALSAAVASMQALQAPLPREHRTAGSRMMIAILCYCQPIVRSWWRYRTRYFSHLASDSPLLAPPKHHTSQWWAPQNTAYWGVERPERTDLVRMAFALLAEHQCGVVTDTGWSNSDLEAFAGPWSFVQVCTAQEEHGSGRRLIRVRCGLKLSKIAWAVMVVGFITTAAAAATHPAVAGGIAAVTSGFFAAIWARGARFAAKVAGVFDDLALRMGLVRCCGTSAEGRTSDGREE